MSNRVSNNNPAKNNRVAELPLGRRILLFSIVGFTLLLILFAFAELAVRARMYAKYGTFSGFHITEYDEQAKMDLPKKYFKSGAIEINSLGFRSPELLEPKPENSIRLAFLGGSTTFCSEVTKAELVWPNVIVEQLQSEIPEKKFEFINASIPGRSVAGSRANFNHRVATHSPDVTFIYHAVNDLAINGWFLAEMQGLKLRTEENTNPVVNLLKNKSLLIELIHTNLLILKKSDEFVKQDRVSVKYDNELVTGLFRQDLNDLVDEVLKVSSLVVIPTFSNQLRREQTEEEQLRAATTHMIYNPYLDLRDMLTGFESFNNVIREMATRENVIVIETEHVIEGTTENFADSVHFSDTGSVRLGKHLADELIKTRLLDNL